MDIGEREVFGLIGLNGAGKRLCSVSAGRLSGQSGEVLMDEEPRF